MSLSFSTVRQTPGMKALSLAAFQRVVTVEVWNTLLAILDAPPVSQTEPVVRQCAELHAEYRAHLEAARLSNQVHPGLEQMVSSLGQMTDDTELQLHNFRTASGRIVLVSDHTGRPIGAVVLRARAA